MNKKLTGILLSAGACVLVVAVGIFGMVTLAASRQTPAHKPEPATGLAVSDYAIALEKARARVKLLSLTYKIA